MNTPPCPVYRIKRYDEDIKTYTLNRTIDFLTEYFILKFDLSVDPKNQVYTASKIKRAEYARNFSIYAINALKYSNETITEIFTIALNNVCNQRNESAFNISFLNHIGYTIDLIKVDGEIETR